MSNITYKYFICLFLFVASTQTAAQFEANFLLNNLNGDNGFIILGESSGDNSGISVSDVGDFNGDDIDDILIGADGASAFSLASAGRSYVIFGSGSGFQATFDLVNINGLNGFSIYGENSDDLSGIHVSSAGDFNDDGIDDIIVGATGADPDNKLNAGRSYLLFGTNQGIPNPFQLSNINGFNGTILNGINANDRTGRSASQVGDINGDGFMDIIVGAYTADHNNNADVGRGFVIYGSDQKLTSPFDLVDVNGLNGFIINGEHAESWSSYSVSQIGDINDDGFDDIVVGAPNTNTAEDIGAGRSYVIYGQNGQFPSPLNLTTLDGNNGFAINGENTEDHSGFSVSHAGDFNGDGLDDLIIGAPEGNSSTGLSNIGRSYVIFGSTLPFPNPLYLSNLNGSNGFRIFGESSGDVSGYSVSNAGDINGDGYDDVIIGAPFKDEVGALSVGRSYVIFGKASGFSSIFYLSNLNGINGFKIIGENDMDSSGFALNKAGDLNNDGLDDIIIGAPYADFGKGRSYVIYGNDVIFKNGLEN